MGNSKGFTMVELMVAGAIAVVLMAVVGSFLMYSGRFSGRVTQSSAAREGLYSALEMIRQDIMQAGTGLAGLYDPTTGLALDPTSFITPPHLVLYVDDLHNTAPWGWGKLYLSYSKHLKATYTTNATDDTDPNNPNLFTHRVWQKAGTPNPVLGDPVSLTTSNLKTTPDSSIRRPVVGPYDIGYLIGEGSVVQLDPSVGLAGGTWDGTFGFVGGAPVDGQYYAPGVAYECRDSITGNPCGTDDADRGALVRNFEANGQQAVLFGGDSTIRVTKFRVKLWYSGPPNSEAELRPSSSNQTFNPTVDTDWQSLRLIEVRIFYQMRGSNGKWPTDAGGNPVELTAVMRAVPRGMVLGQLVTTTTP